jgi:hypothetical protein
MRSIKNIIPSKNGIIRSFNDNKFNLILTPRQWGLTSLLIDYINKIPNDKSVLYITMGLYSDSPNHRRITHTNCKKQMFNPNKLIGCCFDYIICDNFFEANWVGKLIEISPVLKPNSKIILADTGKSLGEQMEYFRNYNIIIKRN